MSRSRCHVPPKPLPLSFSRGSLPSDGSSVLVILFETNPLLWSGLGGRLDGKESFDETLRQLLVYMIGFLSLHEQNRVVIIALHSNVEHCMYAIPTLASGENDLTNTGSKSDLCAQVISNLATLAMRMRSDFDLSTKSNMPLTTVISMALCCVNRARVYKPHCSPRVLCILGSQDSSGQYFSGMNAIFSAKNSGVRIDACLLGYTDSFFLQQAAQITGGSYCMLQQGEKALYYLLSDLPGSESIRAKLQSPRKFCSEYQATCFCHEVNLQVGFVCSVCLTIFCERCRKCLACFADYT